MKTQIVETRSGRLRGRVTASGLFFGGVPYAAPPVGQLRLAPPAPVASWTGVREALGSGPSAPQLAVGRLGPISWLSRVVRGPMSEDCLVLDLATPAADGARRPVLLWLHGGAFVLGAGSTFLYDPSALVAQGDCVVVCPNYRLGALGYLDLTALTSRPDAPSNLGLKDQIAALEWVRDNIESFGGDPDNVTVVGESAGAMSIGALLAATPSLFQRAILESGATANVSTPSQAGYIAEHFLANLGIDADDLEALRAAPLAHILKAQRTVLLSESSKVGKLPWQPSVDGDLLVSDPLSAIERGVARGVDVVVGTNRDEWKLFTSASVALRAMGYDELERRLVRMLEKGGGARSDADRPDAAMAFQLYSRLPRSRGCQETAYEAWTAFRTDEYFRMPAIALAEALVRNGSRSFMYRFDFPIPAFKNALGACHAAEVPLVFGTHRSRWLKPLYLGRRKADVLAEVLQEAWRSFAASGRPSDRETGEWPVYEPGERRTRILGRDHDPVEADPEGEMRRLWRG